MHITHNITSVIMRFGIANIYSRSEFEILLNVVWDINPLKNTPDLRLIIVHIKI